VRTWNLTKVTCIQNEMGSFFTVLNKAFFVTSVTLGINASIHIVCLLL
jgi:hypothetical protein